MIKPLKVYLSEGGFWTSDEPFVEQVNGSCHKGYLGEDGETYKACTRCDKWKLLDQFHKDSASKTGHTYYCKPCANKAARANHKERVKDSEARSKRNDQVRELTRSLKAKAVDYMGDRCHDCGRTFPHYVYDFHHTDPETKESNPSAALRRSWANAVKELDKCIMICANCHRERTYGTNY